MTPTEPTSSMQDGNGAPVHVCILGPSGIGKSPLSALFKLPGMDPLRVREPRSEKDKLLCISERDAIELFMSETGRELQSWPTPKAEADWFVLGERWLFFSAGGDRQCLRFKDDDNWPILRSPKRTEIFAPRLCDILDDRDESRSRVGLSGENLVALLLNPSGTSYNDMVGPDEDLAQVTFSAITKRTELQRKPVDIPDAQKRVRRLPEELHAWKEIKKLIGDSAIEFTFWQHLEFRYHQPDGSPADARRELLSARDTVVAGLCKAAGNPVVQKFFASDVIRSPAEIRELTDIV